MNAYQEQDSQQYLNQKTEEPARTLEDVLGVAFEQLMIARAELGDMLGTNVATKVDPLAQGVLDRPSGAERTAREVQELAGVLRKEIQQLRSRVGRL